MITVFSLLVTFLSVRANATGWSHRVQDNVGVVQLQLSGDDKKDVDDGGGEVELPLVWDRVIPQVSANKVFFAIETSDRQAKLGGALEGQCQTWLQDVPDSAVGVFSDHGEELPFPCKAQVKKCCGHLDYLGDNISAAQFKRELIHSQLHEMLPPDVEWIISTESDVWYNVPLLLSYLGEIEARRPDHQRNPIFAGHFYGPALIMNRRLFEDTLGNASFVNSCRQELLSCLDGKIKSETSTRETWLRCRAAQKRAQFAYEGTLYNNDHLIAYVLQRYAALSDPFSMLRESFSFNLRDATPKCDYDAFGLQMLVGNVVTHSFSVNATGWHKVPENVLMIHHVDANAMHELQALPVSKRDMQICVDTRHCVEACQALHNVSFGGESQYDFARQKR